MTQAKSASPDEPVDMDDLLSTIERRLDRGWVGRTRVRKIIGPQRIEVIAFTTDPEQVRRIERLVTSPGTIEFRILANDRDHKDLIERARKDGGPRVLDADGTLAAWWVPVAPGQEASRQVYPDIAMRIVRGDRGETSEVLVVPDPFDVTDAYLVGATSSEDGAGKQCVRFAFDKRGGMLLGGLTGANLPDKSDGFSRRLGIILNGKLHSALAIRSIIQERGEITGDFDRDEVEDLVNVFNAGALPVRLEKVSELRMSR
jgi:SecD/SecF fusion protein